MDISDETATKRIVVLGAGFGGLATAIRLGKERVKANVILVSRRNYHLFTPLLYQTATGLVDPDHITQLVRPQARKYNFSFFEGEVTEIELKSNKIKTTFGNLSYDYLVLALGSENNDFGVKGVRENTIALKRLVDGEAIHNKIIASLEKAVLEKEDESKRKKLLTFVIIGGGATGVELAGAVRDFVTFMAKDYPGLDQKEFAVIVIEAMKSLLPGLSKYLSDTAREILERRGIEVKLGCKVIEVDKSKVILEASGEVEAENIFWTAGVKPPKLIETLDVEKEKGRVKVDEFLRIIGQSEVFAIGDLASINDLETGQKVPATAQAAVQEGDYVGKTLSRIVKGEHISPFVYDDKGYMLSLGRQVGVAEMKHVRISGFLGWLLWRIVHISLISTTRSRLGVIFDWTFAYFYKRNAAHTEP
jgi:NADH dehydrogenase